MMNENQQQGKLLTRGVFDRTSTRVYPIAALKLTATSLASAQEVVAAPSNEILILDSLSLSNGTGAAVLVSLGVSGVGASLNDENVAIDRLLVAPNSTSLLRAQIMVPPLSRLMAFTNADGSIRVSGWVTANL